VFDGPIDNVSFLAYVEYVLVPTLRPAMWSCSTTSWSINNRGPDRDRAGGRAPAISAAYGPDFNPIEQAPN
jgi:hypothetical protein